MSSSGGAASNADNGSRRRKRARNVSRSEPTQAHEQAERKRTQNRISQQCARERQAAYTRHLESLVEAVRNSSDEDSESKYARLLRAHLKLMDEKLELEDALSRFRQKMLSFGTMAITAAEDKIFDRGGPTSAAGQSSPDGPPIDPAPDEIPLQSSFLADAIRSSTAPEASALPQQGQDHLATDTLPSAPPSLSLLPGEIYPRRNSISADPQAGTIPYGSAVSFLYDIQGPSLGYAPPNGGTTVIDNSTVFAEKIYAAANKVWLERSYEQQRPLSDPQSAQPSAPPQLLKDIVANAVEVIGSLAGLGPYIYGVKFSPYLESVIRWRITGSIEDRLAIPEPFRPTPLQWSSLDHPIVIDFINWPTIRDQMILLSHSLDLDALCRDLVLNTVIELRHLNASVGVHELFVKCVLPRVQGLSVNATQSMLYDRQWVYLKVASPPEILCQEDSCPSEDALAAEIAIRMGLQLQGAEPLLPGTLASKAADAQPPQLGSTVSYGTYMKLCEALALHGINKVESWKLSKDFARKYPFIDCTGVISGYETVSPPPYSTVPR
ncbi:hypothetical protein GQ53DRAFT_835227 [Thozetella sp. PMI_491]|nr:hypothetical protein GQ53DRAFT_835227 [Thozetella sp. PMI_491]